MSAFLVSFAHINVLLTFAKHQQLVLPHPVHSSCISSRIETHDLAQEMGIALLKENVRSLNYRYGENGVLPRHLANAGHCLDVYRFCPDPRGVLQRSGTALAIIKATHCYDYQSCETPDYLTTWAADVMRHIREGACYLLPGYDDAPWGFDDLALH